MALARVRRVLLRPAEGLCVLQSLQTCRQFSASSQSHGGSVRDYNRAFRVFGCQGLAGLEGENGFWRGSGLLLNSAVCTSSSRDYCGLPAAVRLPVPELSPLRSAQRSLFLKATADHAAFQYLENEDRGVAVISLNRPEARNAIGAEMLKQLHSILGGMRHGTSARVLIVCSTVPGVFCAGADLKERRKMGVSETEKFVSSLRSTFTSLEELQIPTIAAIEGPALGGGLELALACDLRICGEEAVFGLPETSLAIIPGAGGTQRLPRVIGRSRAKELIFTADRIDAKRAEAIGLVDHCVQEGEAYSKALAIAQKILAQGPLAVKVAKHAIEHGIEMDSSKGMIFEEACYTRLLRSSDRLEGLAAFAEKRKPVYRGE